ncbi:hypothetical protein BD309DRAFT_31636 [Dichomitus squalens]|uniref:F-box domain-containing protein n=1 Tax=Dichomitus squalens TaxID=114155 RepID=A0A4Q9PKG5_9APHY|nr:hypothetical protein BD311DRAFT_655782 [Dichomitus squalens]TBU44505.1 hypothetical protein BD309DRAFT_31636 [Dichomitus squalens]TBU54637.1 hypothetical protein BD310DRAFT_935435 [Dichomitus squalens]
MLADVLPSDIWITILHHLEVADLAKLAQTSRYFLTLVNEYGWKIHLKANSRTAWSLSKSLQLWTPYAQVRHHTITDRNWSAPRFVARPLASKWTGKLQPHLAINGSRLFVAAASHIYSYKFGRSEDPASAPSIQFECAYMTNRVLQAARDITSIECVPDGGFDRTVYVGYADGTLERVVLPACKPGAQSPVHPEATHREKKPYHGTDAVESISTNGDHILSLSSSGTAVFFSNSVTDSPPQFIELRVRSWATHLSNKHAVLGASSLTPLTVHALQESRISSTPSHILTNSTHDDHPRASAVYGISGAPRSAPWGASESVVISGWYDGVVNVHDLRSSRRAHRIPGVSSYPSGGALYPVMSMCDPWLFEPIYDVSAGGGNGCHIAAGTARHSVVAFWDVRAANRGWSVHAPGNDSSPVYSVKLESSRLFGATQSRPFVFDFGPGAKEETYPPLTRPPKEDGLKRRDSSGVGFYVTRYGHTRPH